MDYYPNPATKCFYNILKRAKIAVDEDVQLLLTYPSGDAIPCIGMVDMPHGTVEKYFGYNKTVLPVDHPAYDPEHPDAEYITERVLHKQVLELYRCIYLLIVKHKRILWFIK